MVHPARFELTTFYSGGRRSIQLSYGCPYILTHNITPDWIQGKCRSKKKRKIIFPALFATVPATEKADFYGGVSMAESAAGNGELFEK